MRRSAASTACRCDVGQSRRLGSQHQELTALCRDDDAADVNDGSNGRALGGNGANRNDGLLSLRRMWCFLRAASYHYRRRKGDSSRTKSHVV